MGRALHLAGLAAGLAGLLLQFAITIPASLEAGRSLAGSVVFFFSFFTILTNIAAVSVHATGIPNSTLSFFYRPAVRAGVVVAMIVVFLVYVTVLAPLWTPSGLFFVCDVILHYVTPAIIVVWWLAAGADGSTRLRDVPFWLIYPVLYLAYVLVRAPLAGEVPYPFLDYATKGATSVATSSLLMTALFLAVCLVVVLADRIVSRMRPSRA